MAHGTVLGISAARADDFTEVVNLAAREPVRRLVFGEQTAFRVGLSLVQSTRERSNVINVLGLPKIVQELILSAGAVERVCRNAVHIEQGYLKENSFGRGVDSDSCRELLQKRPARSCTSTEAGFA